MIGGGPAASPDGLVEINMPVEFSVMQRMTGMLIGTVFGTIFVIVNAHDPLSPAIGVLLRAAAVLGLVSVICMWVLAVKRARSTGVEPATPAQNMFSPGYWLIVVAEAALLYGGIAVLRSWDRPEETNVAWVAFVVGVHFIALGPIWKQRSIMVPGVILTAYGVAGIVVAATSAVEWVPLISGVSSGVTLLAGCITIAWLGLVSQSADGRVARDGREAVR